MFIVQHLGDAFKPNFPNQIINYFIEKQPELSEERYQKIAHWYQLFNHEDFEIRRNTMNQLWNIVLQEITATETALLTFISSLLSGE